MKGTCLFFPAASKQEGEKISEGNGLNIKSQYLSDFNTNGVLKLCPKKEKEKEEYK